MTGTASRRSSALPRTGFNSAELIRLLGELDVADVAGAVESTQGLAERLGAWLDWTDAISLSAALEAGAADSRPNAPPAARGPGIDIVEEFNRVRSALGRSIATDELWAADKSGFGKVLTPAAGLVVAPAADFLPYRRCHAAHQRAMAASIGPLRTQVRAALSAQSPALGRLAALDAAMDAALAPRERQWLSTLPTLLERHFVRLGRAHPQPDPNTPADAPPQPAAWLAVFCSDMRAVLLAELTLRLLPVEGMIEALRDEATIRQ